MEELIKKYNLQPHIENGSFAENHYKFEGEGRAPSGSTYYYIAPGERTIFHTLDCDEYWCYHGGGKCEVWTVNGEGKLNVLDFGLDEESDVTVYLQKGIYFAARNMGTCGTFFSCITVPRFDYKGLRLFSKQEMLALCPGLKDFYKG